MMVNECWNINKKKWVMNRYGWMNGERNNMIDDEGKKLWIEWSKKGNNLKSLDG
jgi:hypothetical protein